MYVYMHLLVISHKKLLFSLLLLLHSFCYEITHVSQENDFPPLLAVNIEAQISAETPTISPHRLHDSISHNPARCIPFLP